MRFLNSGSEEAAGVIAADTGDAEEAKNAVGIMISNFRFDSRNEGLEEFGPLMNRSH